MRVNIVRFQPANRSPSHKATQNVAHIQKHLIGEDIHCMCGVEAHESRLTRTDHHTRLCLLCMRAKDAHDIGRIAPRQGDE